MNTITDLTIINDILNNKDLTTLMSKKPFITFDCVEGEKPSLNKLLDETRLQVNDKNEISMLGFINGILPELTGKVLVEIIDDADGSIKGYDIRDKWW